MAGLNGNPYAGMSSNTFHRSLQSKYSQIACMLRNINYFTFKYLFCFPGLEGGPLQSQPRCLIQQSPCNVNTGHQSGSEPVPNVHGNLDQGFFSQGIVLNTPLSILKF